MSIHSFHGVARIRAEASGHSDIFLDLVDHDGGITTITMELEEELHPARDLIVRAINSAAGGLPRPESGNVIGMPRRAGLAWGDPTRPLRGGGGEAA